MKARGRGGRGRKVREKGRLGSEDGKGVGESESSRREGLGREEEGREEQPTGVERKLGE